MTKQETPSVHPRRIKPGARAASGRIVQLRPGNCRKIQSYKGDTLKAHWLSVLDEGTPLLIFISARRQSFPPHPYQTMQETEVLQKTEYETNRQSLIAQLSEMIDNSINGANAIPRKQSGCEAVALFVLRRQSESVCFALSHFGETT